MLFLRLLALALLSSGSPSLKQAGAALFLQRGMSEAEVFHVLHWEYGLGNGLALTLYCPEYGVCVSLNPTTRRVMAAHSLLTEQPPQPYDGHIGACFLRPRPTLDQVKLAGPHVPASVVFSPDGKILATAGWDCKVKLRDVASGEKIATFVSDEPASPVFSPDGKTLATAGWDNTLMLWDVATGRSTAIRSDSADGVRPVAFGRDGKTLVSAGSYGTIKLWDIATGKTTAVFRTGSPCGGVALSPDGKTLASGHWDGTVTLWDPASGRNTATLVPSFFQLLLELFWARPTVRTVAFSPDGRTLAASTEQVINLWDVTSRRNTAILWGHTHWVTSVAFSPDGKTLASGSADKTVNLWDVSSGRRIRTLRGHSSFVQSVAFSPDGRILAVGSSEMAVRLWDLAAGTSSDLK
jgi:WD40 repeat protein